MSPARTLLIAAAAVAGLSACAPISRYSGFQAIENRPADVKVGEDTKSTVLARLGSPSTTSTFEPNVWYYVSQVTSKVAYKNPKLRSRDVVAITFSDDEKVEAVNTYDATDGFRVAYNKDETPTRGRQMTVLEQLLGNVGRGGMLPNDDDYGPGQRPGER